MSYKSLIIALKAINNCYRRQPVCAIKAVTYLSAYFFRLRAALDNKLYPALVIDRRSGSILSSNLPAFELFAIDAVGFRILDFIVNREAYQQMVQELQQTGETHCTILLHNADGYLMDCKVDATIAPHYSGWMIFRFSANQQSPCPLHSSR